jgi:hypothetical protein
VSRRASASEVFQLILPTSVPNTPLSVGFKIGMDRSEETGAVLVTSGQVTHNQIDPLGSTKAKDWFIINAEKILQTYETTKEKGIFVVTKTYTAKQRAVALLRSKETSISFGVNVELEGLGKIAPDASWWTSQKEQEWKLHKNVRVPYCQILAPTPSD